MQKINYKEKIELKDKINELVLINIDDKLNQSKQSDCLIVNGTITISGEANTINDKESFNHVIDVDIMLSNEQLISEEVTISIDDFNYQIEDKFIFIDLVMKIDGLKEIEAYFPAQEDQESIEIETENEEIEIIRKEPCALEDTQEEINEETQQTEEQESEPIIEEPQTKEKFSLLKQVFKNRAIKKETSYLLHVVKEETSYTQIASIYNLDPEIIRKANNDEEITKGKLVFIPKE